MWFSLSNVTKPSDDVAEGRQQDKKCKHGPTVQIPVPTVYFVPCTESHMLCWDQANGM